MSTEIDWSKAPEGFSVWIQDLEPDLGSDLSGWHRELSDRYVGHEGGHWLKENEGEYFTAHHRPEKWSGEGLPPVGTVCEGQVRGYGEWQKFTVLAHHNGHVWVAGDDGKHCMTVPPHGKFRPIRTPEQIAAEEREKVIAEMLAACPYPGSPVSRSDCEHLYKAGYRKVEGGAE